MSLLRAFIAIELPKITLDSIEKQTARLRQTLGNDIIRWVPAQNMHLTLKFLGDIATSHVDFLKQLLTREADSHPQFNLQLGGLGSFPTSRRPRLLWIGIHAPADLASLQKSIEAGTFRLGYEQEERAFSPHLTIGRTRQSISQSELQKIRAALGTIQLGNIGTVRVDSIHLIKSDLQPSGSIYTKLFSAPLSKP
jgi:RNA 2',3'-cyclic 3'-phosphodiesterase